MNDLIAATARGQPDRFQGFPTLHTPAPEAAAQELKRDVTRLGLLAVPTAEQPGSASWSSRMVTGESAGLACRLRVAQRDR